MAEAEDKQETTADLVTSILYTKKTRHLIQGNCVYLALICVYNGNGAKQVTWYGLDGFGTRLSPVGDRLFRSPNSTTISQVMLSIGPNQ